MMRWLEIWHSGSAKIPDLIFQHPLHISWHNVHWLKIRKKYCAKRSKVNIRTNASHSILHLKDNSSHMKMDWSIWKKERTARRHMQLKNLIIASPPKSIQSMNLTLYQIKQLLVHQNLTMLKQNNVDNNKFKIAMVGSFNRLRHRRNKEFVKLFRKTQPLLSKKQLMINASESMTLNNALLLL